MNTWSLWLIQTCREFGPCPPFPTPCPTPTLPHPNRIRFWDQIGLAYVWHICHGTNNQFKLSSYYPSHHHLTIHPSCKILNLIFSPPTTKVQIFWHLYFLLLSCSENDYVFCYREHGHRCRQTDNCVSILSAPSGRKVKIPCIFPDFCKVFSNIGETDLF